MKFYQEITLMEQVEIPIYFLWSKVYTQLHIAFVEHIDEQKKIPFGVSFPQYHMNQHKKTGFLGEKIRIFAKTEHELQQLNLAKWLERLTDYVHITSPREIPQAKVTGYAHYYRINPKMSLEERIIHQAQRRNISVDEVKQYFLTSGFVEQATAEPYIQLKSLSAKREQNIDRAYRLYIGKSPADEAKNGKFGTYGLSRVTTVPEF